MARTKQAMRMRPGERAPRQPKPKPKPKGSKVTTGKRKPDRGGPFSARKVVKKAYVSRSAKFRNPERHDSFAFWGEMEAAMDVPSDPMPELPGENDFIGHSSSADHDKQMLEYYNPRFARHKEMQLPQHVLRGMWSLPPHLRSTTYTAGFSNDQRMEITKEQFAKTYWE